MLGGARLAGDFREAEKVGLGKTARANGEYADGLRLRGALENHGVEILDAAGKLGLEAQSFVEFFDALVKLRGALEIELGAGALAVGFDGGAERVAAAIEKLHEAGDFRVVFLLGASGKARREAHFHFGIDAARKSRIAADFDLAAADLEQIESFFGEGAGGFPGREGAVVGAGSGRAGIVQRDVARDVAARIGVAQADFEDGGRAEASQFAIAPRKKMFGDLVVGEGLLEPGAGEAIADAAREIAKVEPLARRIGGAEKTLEAAAQILRADKERLGVFRACLDQADGGAGRKRGEKVFVARRVEVLAAIEFQHGDRITRKWPATADRQVPPRDRREGHISSSPATSACGGDVTSLPEAHRSPSSRLRQKAQETVHEVGSLAALHKKGPKTPVQTTNLAHQATCMSPKRFRNDSSDFS